MEKKKIHIHTVVIRHMGFNMFKTSDHLIYKISGINNRTNEEFERGLLDEEEILWIYLSFGRAKHIISIILEKYEMTNFCEAITEVVRPDVFVGNMIASIAQWSILIIAEVDGECETYV